MDFLLDYKVKSSGLDDSWKSLSDVIARLAEDLTEEQYHEICHQLHGEKAEYDGKDDGEYHSFYTNVADRNRRVVSDALYRGIFARTLEALRKEDLED